MERRRRLALDLGKDREALRVVNSLETTKPASVGRLVGFGAGAVSVCYDEKR